jgi:YVTN family beta-propeller protein
MTFFRKRIGGVFAIGLCAAMVAGCGGGAVVGTSAMRPQSQSSVLTEQSTNGALSTKAANGNVTFAIGIKPKTKAGRITPKYVSPSTQSLQILTDGTNPVVVTFGPWSPNCSPNPTVPGAYICTASLNIPAGNHVFTLTTYDLPGADGTVLSTNSTGTVFVKPTGTTTVSLVLEGVVRSVVLTLWSRTPPVGNPAAIGLTIVLEDADQNLIIGSAPFDHPVTLTTTDPAAGPLSKSILRSPADAAGITVDYSGAAVTRIVYSATAVGLSAANVTDDVLTPGAPAEHFLYVANRNIYTPLSEEVSIYDLANLAAAPRTINTSPQSAMGVALDVHGKLYVTSWLSNIVSVFDTQHGNSPLPTITGGSLSSPIGVTVGADGKLYAANINIRTVPLPCNCVSVFDTANGNTPLPPIIGGGLNQPFYVAVGANGKLYVSNDGDSTIRIFDTAHGNTPLAPITGGGLDAPSGMALDANGKLYVANAGSNTVSVFDTEHGNAPLPAISGGLVNPRGVAIDAAGKLYVASNLPGPFGGVSIFDTAHGNASLPAIAVGYPEGLAIH